MSKPSNKAIEPDRKPCVKCGAPAITEKGQRWNDGIRKYQTAYRLACRSCGNAGPVCLSETAAVIAWNAEQRRS